MARASSTSALSFEPRGGPQGRLSSFTASGSSNENVEPRPAIGLDPDPAAHPAHDLAADVEAEARAADAAREIRVEAIELLEDPLVLGGRDSESPVADGESHTPLDRLQLELDPAAVRGVLDRVLDQVDEHLAKPVRICSDVHVLRGHSEYQVDAGGQVCLGRRNDRPCDLDRVGRPISKDAAPESSRLASRMSLTILASRSDSPAITPSIPSCCSSPSTTSSRLSVIAAP